MATTNGQAKKPLVLFACPTAQGHTFPLLPHAAHLNKQGYDIFFIGATDFEDHIRRTGAAFYPTENPYTPDIFEEVLKIPEGPARMVWSMKTHFIDTTPARMKSLKEALEDMREKHPDRDVILVQEMVYMGAWPFLTGAPLPKGYDKFPRTIGFGTVPLPLSSIDTAPFGPGFPPDASAEGRARNAAMYEAAKPMNQELTDHTNKVWGELGSTVKMTKPMFDFMPTSSDINVLPCSASLEYPRSDMPSNIRFIGGTPPKEIDPAMELPAWWDELLENKKAASPKKVIFVSQGTFALDYKSLLIPTIQTLADRDDLIVIGVLGVKGAKLDGVEIPRNAKVVDYLMYEAVLPHTDVFVTNAGYGGFILSVMHGVPMLLAGTGRKFSFSRVRNADG